LFVDCIKIMLAYYVTTELLSITTENVSNIMSSVSELKYTIMINADAKSAEQHSAGDWENMSWEWSGELCFMPLLFVFY
jgi:hypothetical protein